MCSETSALGAKKFIWLILIFLFSVSHANNDNFINKINLSNNKVSYIYNKIADKLDKNITLNKDNFKEDDLNILKQEINIFNENFKNLQENVEDKDRTNWKINIENIKASINKINSLITEKKPKFKTIKNKLDKIEIQKNNKELKWKYWELMYYNDSFEGKHTSAWNIFSQEFFSAAKCGTPLNTLTQVILNQKSLLIKVNDRPSCSRFPNLIDLSTNAFDPLYRRYAGKQKWEYIELQAIGKDYYKRYIPVNFFKNAGISVSLKTPNSFIWNETFNLIWNSPKTLSYLNLTLISPKSEKTIYSKKDLKWGFLFSIPLNQIWTYRISFSSPFWTSPEFEIYNFSPLILNWKKLFPNTDNISLLSEIQILNEPAETEKNRLRFVIWNNNVNSIHFSQDSKNLDFYSVWDIVIFEDSLNIFDSSKPIKIQAFSSKTLTNFSLDSYSLPVKIFSGEFVR
ncbi:MAG: hypothetical protein ACD_49C00074G0033 [uncultured bacterium (gcode 4)]|uniref:RlpA-like protein double-psi beta-barrel domain-containing protein n=1 Tax=uncultured bacterium (gcode 4) TaxID=1234023 RepID=K2AW72_9BACT|nr:MAG: hypothetical protein ACD_49C00074G0033 [uncultured bacterium (gcode 4)]